jgi:outer membrane protein assembly factor BamB
MKPSILFPTILTLAISCLNALAADWPTFRGPNRNGIVDEPVNPAALSGGVTPVWRGKVGTGFSAIAVAAGRLYTMGNDKATDTVWCLDANTGAEIWKHSYAEELKPNLYEGGPNASPTVHGGRVFTLSKTGKAFCFDAAKGTVLWQADLAELTGAAKPEWGYSGAPLIQGDLVIYNVGTEGTALNKDSGKLAWKSGAEKSGYSSPLPCEIGGRQLVLLMTAKHAIALNPSSGEVAWRYPWETSYDINAADPIVAGDKVFISSGYNHGAAVLQISDNKPAVIWENKNLRNQFASSVLWEGHLYGVDDKQLRCVNFADGKVKWSDSATGKGTLIIAGGRIVALSEKGELLVADASEKEFKPLGRAQILGGKCWTMPTLANGKLYARNAKGDLVCVEVGVKD